MINFNKNFDFTLVGNYVIYFKNYIDIKNLL